MKSNTYYFPTVFPMAETGTDLAISIEDWDYIVPDDTYDLYEIQPVESEELLVEPEFASSGKLYKKRKEGIISLAYIWETFTSDGDLISDYGNTTIVKHPDRNYWGFFNHGSGQGAIYYPAEKKVLSFGLLRVTL